MTEYSADVAYAYVQLGLDAGASLEKIENVLANAHAYRFSMRERVKQIERFAQFFVARSQLGTVEDSFADIRKSYHKQVLALHPDRNRGDKHAEEHLKTINALYAIVAEVHREAKDYYRYNDSIRREIETEARRATEKEKPARTSSHEDTQPKPVAEPRPAGFAPQADRAASSGFSAVGGRRYMAASIPRFMRTARLSHLRLDCVIGCWFIKRNNDIHLIYDVIMLPEQEFMRARAHLGMPNVMNPALQRGGLTPSYVPQDVKEVTVPPGESDPEAFAKNYFRHEFAMEHKIMA